MKELNEVPDLESCYRLLGIAESRLMLLREVENLLIKGTDNRFVFKIRAKEFFNLFKITINQINLIGKLIKYHLLEESKTWTL